MGGQLRAILLHLLSIKPVLACPFCPGPSGIPRIDDPKGMCNVGPQYQLRLRGAAAAPRLLALTLALAAAFAAAPPVQAQTAQQAAARVYRIPAGPLEPALADFAKAAGITVSFRPEDAAGLSTQGLQGSYEAGAGLDRLLSGTGLTAVPQPGQGYVLRGAAARST
jgi:hypothetical protein